MAEAGEKNKGQKSALGVLGILVFAGLIFLLSAIGVLAHIPAVPLGLVIGLIVVFTMIFGKFY